MIIMKKIRKHIEFCIIFLFIFLISNSVKGQDPFLIYIEDCLILDSAYFEIRYEVKIIPDANNDSSNYEDIQVLQIGKNVTKTFSYPSYQIDSAATEWLKQGKDTYPSKPFSVTTYEIYKKININKIDFIDIIYDEVFLYEEETPRINWQIHHVKKDILDHSCQKATAEFRGREYVAWFALDIPISDGPYKFTGLPGLILEIHDTQEHYNYKCIGIKSLNPMLPITRRDWRLITTITRENYNSLYRQFCDDPLWLVHQQGATVIIMVNGEEINSQNFSLPYNPIELE